jgi:hypothetical protein
MEAGEVSKTQHTTHLEGALRYQGDRPATRRYTGGHLKPRELRTYHDRVTIAGDAATEAEAVNQFVTRAQQRFRARKAKKAKAVACPSAFDETEMLVDESRRSRPRPAQPGRDPAHKWRVGGQWAAAVRPALGARRQRGKVGEAEAARHQRQLVHQKAIQRLLRRPH